MVPMASLKTHLSGIMVGGGEKQGGANGRDMWKHIPPTKLVFESVFIAVW